jgi:predicted permease
MAAGCGLGYAAAMSILAEIIFPVFGLLAFGYGATFTPVFDQAAGRALASFVFWFAIPVMLFRNMALQDLPHEVPWGFLVSYYGGALAIFAAGMVLMGRLFGSGTVEQGILGFGASYSNIVLLGTPLVLTSFGPAATLPFFLILSFHSALMFTAVTVVIEVGRGEGSSLRTLPLRVGQGLAKNPILIALLGGLLWHALGLGLPVAVDAWGKLVAGAAGPCALFSMGASLRAYGLKGALGPALVMVALKNALHPLLVWVLAALVFTMPALWVKVAVITAALPAGVNGYLFAERYGIGQAQSAAAIILSTAVSVLTLAVLLNLLGVAPAPGATGF